MRPKRRRGAHCTLDCMFKTLHTLLEALDDKEFESGVQRICKMSATERQGLLERMHHLSSMMGKAIGTVELLTSQVAGTLWKRKKKKSNAPSQSKQRFCAVRVDGLHYYDKEGGDRLGVIERTRIEDCILLENGKTFDLLCNDGVVLEFTVTDATQASKWVDVLKPKKVVADKEGWLFKKKEKKGLTTAISRSKKRWCVLSSDSFKYFENKEGGGRCLGALPLQEMTASLIGEGESQTIRLMHGKESYAFASCPDGGPPLAEWVNSINRLTALLKTQTPIIRKSGNSKSSQNSSAVNPANKMKQSPPRSVGVASSVKKPEGTVSQRGQEDDGEEENFVNEQFEAEPVRSPRGKVSVPRVSGAAAAKRKVEAEAARQRELEAAEELSSEEPIPIDYGNDYQDSAEISAETPAGRAAPVARNSGRGGRVVSRASKDSPGAPRGRGVASNRISRIPEKKLPETMYVENDHLLDEDSSE